MSSLFRKFTAFLSPSLYVTSTFAFKLFTLISSLGTKFVPSVEKGQVEGDIFKRYRTPIYFLTDPSVTEISLFFNPDTLPKRIYGTLGDLRGHFDLKRLVLQAPHLRLDEGRQMVAVRILVEAVIDMSLLIHLSVPETLVTDFFLLHVSLLPRLETLIVSPAPVTNNLFGEESHGFVSLRSLDLPDERLLRRLLYYPLQDLKILKVGGLGRSSLQKLCSNLTGLRQLSFEDANLDPQDIFMLGACFQLEDIKILTQYPWELGDLELHRFRGMFRNLRSLSVVTREPQSRTGVGQQ